MILKLKLYNVNELFKYTKSFYENDEIRLNGI